MMLRDLIEGELTSIPIEHWGDYFPVQVALMRYLERLYPGRISLQTAGVDAHGPYLSGQGVDWFVDHLWCEDELLDMVDALLVATLKDLKQRFPDGVDSPETVAIDDLLASRIEDFVSKRAEAAARAGAF